jgi:hypothetical protein
VETETVAVEMILAPLRLAFRATFDFASRTTWKVPSRVLGPKTVLLVPTL